MPRVPQNTSVASQADDHELRRGGGAGFRHQPDGRKRGHAQSEIRQASVHRARRLLPGSAAQVSPPQDRRRGAAEKRIHRAL